MSLTFLDKTNSGGQVWGEGSVGGEGYIYNTLQNKGNFKRKKIEIKNNI